MCGIGGKISFGERPDSRLVDRMNAVMTHRGPDADGAYASGPAVLAHRRLSILDLSDAGRQPMSSADGRVHVVFNGEIYNYRELREDLPGYSFDSGTDTEVLLHLYEEEGIDCLDRLRGMYAFAVWDERTERLFLARDRLGQKPLFYRRDGDAFWFGSTIRTILADDRVTAEPDLPALRSYLTYQYVPNPATGFAGIEQLRPGEYAIFDADGFRRESYWDLSFAGKSDASPGRLADRLRAKLKEATRLRLRSDVPVGVFLSGGVDSSIVTALMDEVGEGTVSTYSIGFDQADYDELEFAREVAGAYGTDHHEYTVTPDSVETIPRLVEEYEMPFGDPSALPTYYVSKVAAEDLTVALGGDAGDENFAGYDRYTWDKVVSTARRVPAPVRRAGARFLEGVSPALGDPGPLKRGRRVLELAEKDPVARYAEFVAHATAEDADGVWAGPRPDDEYAALRRAFERADGPTRMDRVQHADIQTYLPDDGLVKVDRASMAHSLEVRSPFLDHELVEFAASVPAKYKWRRGTKKWLLKRAFADALPDAVLNREKQGFSVPVDEWFRGELREYARDRLERLGSREPFHRQGLTATLGEHVDGDADHGHLLWDLVLLEVWYDRFID